MIDFGVPNMDSHPAKNLEAVFSAKLDCKVGMILVNPVSRQVQLSSMS
jgi:hypothetical protein